MNLPPSLAPWSRYLNIFPEEISLALGPLIQRISLAVGSPRSRFNEKEGEPDGFDGFNRRGSYEHLLLHEWMLADEMPEEFMRRAVMGEHLFLNPARSSPVGTRASLALFDAGPNQLGTPRIAHLAALIVLSNRAESAGATFGWGVLQQPATPIFGEFNTSNVMRLLDARSHREVTEKEIEDWESKVATWSNLDDLWIVGGPRLSRLKTGKQTSRLYVHDKLDPRERQLSASVCAASSLAAEFVLDLPDNKTCTRLLRDPFKAAVAEIQKVSQSPVVGSNLLFDGSATKLFVRSENWAVTAFNIPNSPRAGTGRPKQHLTRRWHTISAVGRIGRAIALISAEDRFVRLEFSRQGVTKLPPGNYTGYNQNVFYTPPSDPQAPLTPCFLLPWEGEIAALDAAGSLFRLVQLKGEEKSIGGKPIVGTVHLIATNVLAAALWNSRLVYVGMEWPGPNQYIVSLGADIARIAIPFEGEARQAFFGPPSSVAHEKFGLLAIEQNEFQWAIVTAKGESILARPNGAKVVGVLAERAPGSEPGLLALENDQRTLTLNGRNWRKKVLEANGPIDRVAVSQTAPYIAYSTANGEIVVYSLTHSADLCRYLTEVRS